LLFFIFVFLG